MARILIATSNEGKLRDFAAAAAEFGIEVAAAANLSAIPPVEEDQPTYEANARKKAEHYTRFVAGELLIADDSGLEVEALGGEPGVRSARFAAGADNPHASDEENNVRLLRVMQELRGEELRRARFVCWIAAARDGKTLAAFRGEAEGIILLEPRGHGGFGYDPLFYVPELNCTFAELAAEDKAKISHRGKAFRAFLEWYAAQPH